MVDPSPRVALLARPGAACDNLQAALRQAGAELVAMQDPGEGDPAAIAAAHPAAVLVALEPAVEDALERYAAVLSEPGRLVIYDEVAVAARREGWDAARWARHLAAKLGGHADVLPPGAGSDSDLDLPRVATAAGVAPPEPAAAAFDADAVHLGAEPAHEEALAKAGEGIDFGGFTPEMMAAMAMAPMDMAEPEPPAPPEAEPEATPEADADALPRSEAEPDTQPSGSPDRADDTPPAATASAPDIDVLEWEAPAPIAPAPVRHEAPVAATPGAPVRFSADEMTLVDMDAAADARAPRGAPFAAQPTGAVVVLAGIGGPDAVRQFLAALPGGFARPIIVRQRLDGGRHDRLVRQMQRATALPVELAEAGRLLIPGHVYILPDGITTAGDGAARFVATEGAVPVLAGLPADQSAVLVLSGSDPASVPEAMEAARSGAFVAGQSPEDSFDGAAAAALVAAGGDACTAAELAQRLSSRWNS
jgi:chemosensory pili system protein ChpB (putative protein-glutamate methylesterase)